MKLTQYNTKIFISELDDLSNLITKITNQANTWLEGQERRDKGWGVDQYHMQAVRIALEDQLNEIREKMALVYDFQGDRGMADFVPAGFGNEPEEVEEEETETIDPIDFSFFPKKKENLMRAFFDNFYQAKAVS
jgi:hypothetical protein